MPEGADSDYYWHYQTDRVFGLGNSYSLQTRRLGYSSGAGAFRRVIVALAEELLVMLVISLLGVSLSAVTSLKPNS